MRGTGWRVWSASAVAVVAVCALTACEAVVANHVDVVRTEAALPKLPAAADLTTAARQKSQQLCTATAVEPTPDPLGAYGGGTALAVDELVASAPLDPSIASALSRNLAATDVIWAQWKQNPTFVDPRWDDMGVGEVTCGDGNLYMTLLLRDAPTPGVNPEGKTWLFMGQELGAVGGFPGDQDQGYVDYVGTPAGVTIYTDLRYAAALRLRYDVGYGIQCGQCYLDNPAFDDAMVAIGLNMVGDLPAIVAGQRDASITALGDFIDDIDRPVFLRIGYEFDGSWNGYDPALYVQAFRRVMNRLQAQGVTNVVSVWQSSGFNTNRTSLMQWYPGDAYVDWIGYSYFKQSNPSGGMIGIAREKAKPVMIAEATPMRNLALGDPETHWSTWFAPFFAHIHANQDVIKAVAYINTRWFDQAGWGAGWGDSRVQIRPEIKARWLTEMQDPMWAPGNLDQAGNTYVLTPHDLTPP